MIEARGATLSYKDQDEIIYACRQVSLTIQEGEFVGVVGPSGSGKSSLLFLLSGLKDPTEGEILYKGVSYKTLSDAKRASLRRQEFGFILQHPFLLGYLTALENVLCLYHEIPRAKERGLALLEALGIRGTAHRFPAELSTGEKQRVSVARAILHSPHVIFADEPTASVDREMGQRMVHLIRAHFRGTLILATHDPTILKDADRIITIESGQVREVSDKHAVIEKAFSPAGASPGE
ncbi:MAG: ATP-binding cassette domain-containing protein [Candidatus Caldarchaeum sp.]